jgi:hypothetical protein
VPPILQLSGESFRFGLGSGVTTFSRQDWLAITRQAHCNQPYYAKPKKAGISALKGDLGKARAQHR